MATTVKITETYDLKTTKNALGIIGIHTPSALLINRLYPGLVKNHKYLRMQKCDIKGVCASVLPADPLQVGVESGDVAPEDMFNPILYRPVSNDSFDTMLGLMYATGNDVHLQSLNKGDVSGGNAFPIYYSLLAESKRWKKAMPQNGFALRGLYPICHTMISTYGNVYGVTRPSLVDNDFQPLPAYDQKSVPSVNRSTGVYSSESGQTNLIFNGKSVKMPKFPLHTQDEYDYSEANGTTTMSGFNIPKTFVAMFVLPPARLHEFYYRMRITWTMTFSGVISAVENASMGAFSNVNGVVYNKDFSYSNKDVKLANNSDLVDTDNVEIKKIMES